MATWTTDVGLLALRLGVSYVMLYAAWKNTENSAAWNWTVNETAILFRSSPDEQRQRTARFCAIVGMILMYGGGASVLLGLEPRVGGLAIAVLCSLGTIIHGLRRE